MRTKQFNPTHYVNADDGSYFLVMFAHSEKNGEKSAFSVRVDRETGAFLGRVVESRIVLGFNSAPCFSRDKKRYYLSWLKPLPKRVDKK